MDKITEDLKCMFYQVALATEKKRLQLDQLKELGEKFAKSAASVAVVLLAIANGAWASDQIIKLKDDGTYIPTAQFLKIKRMAEASIQEAVMLHGTKMTLDLRRYDELEVNKVANLLEDNGYVLDEETRLLNPFVLRVSWQPFTSPDEHDKIVTRWAIEEQQREMQFEAGVDK